MADRALTRDATEPSGSSTSQLFAGPRTLDVVLRRLHLAALLTNAASVQDLIVPCRVLSALRVDPCMS